MLPYVPTPDPNPPPPVMPMVSTWTVQPYHAIPWPSFQYLHPFSELYTPLTPKPPPDLWAGLVPKMFGGKLADLPSTDPGGHPVVVTLFMTLTTCKVLRWLLCPLAAGAKAAPLLENGLRSRFGPWLWGGGTGTFVLFLLAFCVSYLVCIVGWALSLWLSPEQDKDEAAPMYETWEKVVLWQDHFTEMVTKKSAEYYGTEAKGKLPADEPDGKRAEKEKRGKRDKEKERKAKEEEKKKGKERHHFPVLPESTMCAHSSGVFGALLCLYLIYAELKPVQRDLYMPPFFERENTVFGPQSHFASSVLPLTALFITYPDMMTFIFILPSIITVPPIIPIPPSLFYVFFPTNKFGFPNWFPDQSAYLSECLSRLLTFGVYLYMGLFFNGFLTRSYTATFKHSPITPAMLFERKHKSTLDNIEQFSGPAHTVEMNAASKLCYEKASKLPPLVETKAGAVDDKGGGKEGGKEKGGTSPNPHTRRGLLAASRHQIEDTRQRLRGIVSSTALEMDTESFRRFGNLCSLYSLVMPHCIQKVIPRSAGLGGEPELLKDPPPPVTISNERDAIDLLIDCTKKDGTIAKIADIKPWISCKGEDARNHLISEHVDQIRSKRKITARLPPLDEATHLSAHTLDGVGAHDFTRYQASVLAAGPDALSPASKHGAGLITHSGYTWDGGRSFVPRTKEFRRPGLQGDFDDLVMSSRFFRFMCAPRDAWTEMEVRRTNNDNFYMGSDDKYGGRQDDLLPIGGKGENGPFGPKETFMRLMVTAKRVKDTFYFSHCPAFPDMWERDEEPTGYYFAKLVVGLEDGHFILMMDVDWSARNLKDKYDDEEKKKLAGNERWKNEPIKEGKNGLLMLDGQQAFTSIKGVDASIRCMKATVLNFGRKFSEGTLGGERNSDMPEAVQVVNRLPEWNKEQKSLVVSFNKQRIATASPKNFILTRQAYIATNTNTDMMMQFGKRRRGVYAMDFKGPVNPLQAFALSLVAFHFRRDEPRPEPA